MNFAYLIEIFSFGENYAARAGVGMSLMTYTICFKKMLVIIPKQGISNFIIILFTIFYQLNLYKLK